MFRFSDGNGTRTETYRPRQRRDPDQRPGQRPDNRPPQGDDRRPPNGNRGGGDPLTRALDKNGDGSIDRVELARAAEVLRTLDRNRDGQITRDELRGGGRPRQDERPQGTGGGRPGRGNLPGQAQRPAGPGPEDGPRQPWILAHATELDTNKDGIISRDEIVGEAERAFGGYDRNSDGRLVESELAGRSNVRSAMGGFIRGHAKELDRDNDGVVTRRETVDTATRMFSKIDRDNDGKLTKAEQEASRQTVDEPAGRRGGSTQKRET